jgi:hypothetical protein
VRPLGAAAPGGATLKKYSKPVSINDRASHVLTTIPAGSTEQSRLLDEALLQTFPASDPVSVLVN